MGLPGGWEGNLIGGWQGPLPACPPTARGLGMQGCLIILVMGANAAGELLPLFQPLGAYLPHNIFTWCLNTRVAMHCPAPGWMRVESWWGKR